MSFLFGGGEFRMYPEIEERVDTLENLLGQFIVHTNLMVSRLERDTREFKDEMREFKNEVRQEQQTMKKQWGDLANKMGTLVEDIIAPAVRPAVKKFFHCDLEHFAVHVKRKRKDLHLEGEFDVIAVSDANQVFLIEAKSTPRKEYIVDFLDNIEKFKQLFPEYAGKSLIPIFASLRFEADVISLATQHKVYVMAYREWDYLEIVNFEDIQSTQRIA
jgi:hypothetical protein